MLLSLEEIEQSLETLEIPLAAPATEKDPKEEYITIWAAFQLH